MDNDKYIRTIQELEKVGSKWWPKEVKEEAEKMSVLQYLLDTQDKFISLLNLADRTDLEQIFSLVEAAKFGWHLFLKHLMILSDIGSEQLQRFNASFSELFADNMLVYEIDGSEYYY